MVKSSFSIAFATLLSRVFGLVRVVFEARIIGGGAAASGWFLAFAIPNLFRRIFGEGALGTALVPMLRSELEYNNNVDARNKFGSVLLFISIILAFIVIICGTGAFFLRPCAVSEKNSIFLQILPVIIPYAFFICLVGALSSVLNMLKVFFLPALSALFFNILMIGTLILSMYFIDKNLLRLQLLSFSVVLSGFLQLIFCLYLLKKNQFLPKIKSVFKIDWHFLKELWKLMIPSLIGASALQLSLIFDKSLAFFLNSNALPALTYSDRLIYLPVGVFAVSFGTVSLSYMSESAVKKDFQAMINSMFAGLKVLLLICIPTAFLFFLLAKPIISIICYGGEFAVKELDEVAYAFSFYCWGIPFFAMAKIMSSAFFSMKDMKTPLKISLLAILVNVLLSISLIFPFKQGGIALATAISSALNNFLLLFVLQKQLSIGKEQIRSFVIVSGKIVFSALLAAILLIYVLQQQYLPVFSYGDKVGEFLRIFYCSTIFGGSYLLFCFVFKIKELNSLFVIFRRFKPVDSEV